MQADGTIGYFFVGIKFGLQFFMSNFARAKNALA